MSKFNHIINIVPLTRVSLAGPKIFSYRVPIKLQESLRTGQLVHVPFGRRMIDGIVSSPEQTKLAVDTKSLKELSEIVDGTPVFSPNQLKLADWLADYYVTPLGLVLKAMLPKFVKTPKEPNLKSFEVSNPDFVLTEHQREAVNEISKGFGKDGSYLLRGVTGSGKTEVYMRLIERLIDDDKQVILLVPEISLTPQAIERFARRFGMSRIALLHSQMKASERHYMWREIRDGKRSVIIGPRSAVFAPVQDLGMIILDEEHDGSYKQFEQNPKYHARTVAKMLSRLWSCPLLLGDATPSVESYYQTQKETTKLLTLPHRIKADLGMPKVQMVDMKREIEAQNFSIFSELLKAQILLNLKLGKQIILFLNRRGSATVVLCRDCGYVLSCKNCTSALVWHETTKKLLCHHCDQNAEAVEKCPDCGSHRIKSFGIGTQKVEAELKKFLSENITKEQMPRIVRMDRDSTRKAGDSKRIYDSWNNGKTQVLIGTQMISKGWDVSAVGLVGIISADTTLNLPDHRSNERTFQTLTQVAGRTGRGDEPGLVILQTYYPDNPAIKAAKNHDYESFFDEEIKQRRLFHYPPFVKLVKLRVEHKSLAQAKRLAQDLIKEVLAKREVKMEIFGPSPAFIPRLRDKYRFQITIKIPYNVKVDLYNFFKDFKTKFDIDIEPESLL